MARRRRRRPHGGGQLVPPELPGGTWGIRWREAGQRRYQGGFATRELAERVLARIAGDVAVGRAGLPRNRKGVPELGVLAGPFLDRRDLTHRAASMDRLRWKKHLKPWFGHRKPHEVDGALVRRFVEAKLAEGLNPATIRILVALLSSLYVGLVEDKVVSANPCQGLPRSTRRLMKPTHDPRTTPFIEKLADIRRIFLLLPAPLSIAYAIGVLAGLRTGEIFALKWLHVDLAARRIHVRESVKGPLKDKDSRMVPILDPLLPILTAWKLKSGGEGLVIPPLRRDGKKIDKHTPGNFLRPVLKALGLARSGLGWYEATRHTFASQWVLAGGSIEKLKELLGHYSVLMTERYAHLRPDLFTAKDLAVLDLDLAGGERDLLPLAPWAERASGQADG